MKCFVTLSAILLLIPPFRFRSDYIGLRAERQSALGRNFRKLRFKIKTVNETTAYRAKVACWLAIAVAIAVTFITSNETLAAVGPTGLRCEHQVAPQAVETNQPRLSWVVSADSQGRRQTAYQILVASGPDKLVADKGDFWNSGKVSDGRTIGTPYAGCPLTSRVSCYWKVRIWNENDVASAWSKPARWTMGLLGADHWHGRWIAAPDQSDTAPLPLMRQEFDVDKPVAQAMVSFCGLGFCELRLNGQKVGNQVLDPGWTNYRRTCLYATHDVTKQLVSGRNALGVMLGNGMYRVLGGRYAKFTGSFGPPKMILQLDVQHTDGTSTRIVSDGSWRMAPGPITFSCIYGGEDHDAQRESSGWDQPSFDDSAWQPVSVVNGPGGRLTAQSTPPCRVIEVLQPAKITRQSPDGCVVDFGQNFSGWPQVTLRGPAGAKIKLVPEELLSGDGSVKQRKHFGPTYFTYTLKGTGFEVWHPRFSYYGFRYLQVEGAATDPDNTANGKPQLLSVEGQWVHADAQRAGNFSCSHELFNRIHAIIVAAIRSNMQSVLTDCPHREKLGWLGVPRDMGPSVMFNYDVPLLYAKVLRDISEAQLPGGMVPCIAPEYTVFGQPYRDMPEGGSDFIMLPWMQYKWYGDRRSLELHYDGMKRYVEYLGTRAQGHIIPYGLGDWCDYGPKTPRAFPQLTPVPLTATALYCYDLKVLGRVAAVLKRSDDAKHYTALAEQVRQAFNRKFFQPDKNQYATGSQTSNAMPLALGLVDKDREAAVLENLVQDIRRHDNHITTGAVGYPWLLRALADAGRSDVICDVVSQTTPPSYGNQLRQGVTSLAESWDANPTQSQNHMMLGHADQWFYAYLAGIRQEKDSVAFDKIVIRPEPAGELRWAKGSYRCVRGLIESHWQRDGDRFRIKVAIPAGSTASVHVPGADASLVNADGQRVAQSKGVSFEGMDGDRAVFVMESGHYQFKSLLKVP